MEDISEDEALQNRDLMKSDDEEGGDSSENDNDLEEAEADEAKRGLFVNPLNKESLKE